MIMHQETLPKLPTINFDEENLKPGTPGWSSTCSGICGALEEYGYFVATYDLIPSALRDEIFHTIEGLFNLPMETKFKNNDEISIFGYYAEISNGAVAESQGIEDVTNLDTIQRFSKLMWPDGNNRFCEIFHRYAKLLSQLEQLVTKMVFESYGIGVKHYDNHINSKTYLFRFHKYRALRDNEKITASLAHTDKTIITIHHQNQINGLQVQRKDGKWITVDVLPYSFVVMAGDGMQAWSNGRVHSPLHHVVKKNREVTRYSIGIFSYHKGILHIPDELIDEEHPPCFKPFNHLEMLRFYSDGTQAGQIQSQGSIAKVYCGV